MPTKQRTQELLLSPGRFLVLGLDQAALSSLRQGCCPAGTVQNCPPLLGSRIGFGGIKCWQEGRASSNPYRHHSNHVLWTVKKIYKDPTGVNLLWAELWLCQNSRVEVLTQGSQDVTVLETWPLKTELSLKRDH